MESRRKKTVLRVAGALVLLVLVSFLVAKMRSGWRAHSDHRGGRLESIGADLMFFDAGEIVERGPSRVLVLRFDGPVEWVPYHYRTEGLDGPKTAEEWRKHLRVPVVFNAGQFDEDNEHLGWLKGDGEWLSKLFREQWKALLVSTPLEGAAWSGILDLEASETALAERYRNVLQSMMLVDDVQGVRVRESDRTANRTVIAQDSQGRMMLVMTEGAVTLANLGRWLMDSNLGVARAMNLDGGLESQVSLEADDVSMSLYGQYGSGSEVFDAGAGALRQPVPAVVAVRPVKATDSRASR